MNFQTYIALATAGILGGLATEAPFLIVLGFGALAFGVAEAFMSEDTE